MAHADTVAHGRAWPLALGRVSWRGAVAAAALPLLFLHVRYQPGVAIDAGSTSVNVALSDVAVAAVVAAALVDGLRGGFGALRAAAGVWTAAAALLVWIGAESLRGGHASHAVSAAKFAEYALLAPALLLLLRRREDLAAWLAVAVAWAAAAAVAGLLQFFGVGILAAWPAGRRQPSFLGHLDFAALGGMALSTGVLWAAARRRGGWIAVAAGVLGVVLAGASAGALGVVAAVVWLCVWARLRLGTDVRTLTVATAAVLVTIGGVTALRGRDFDQFLRFLGVRQEEASTRSRVQTYAQHTLLAYIGWKVFTAHPAVGVGWQGSAEPEHYRPVLPAARRRFPDVARVAFPAPARPYGVQNAYVQILADLGVVGLLLWLALYATALLKGVRRALRAPPARAAVASVGVAWLVLTLALWIPQNLVAGLPLDALVWFGIGLVALADVDG